ncbi:MAG: hypothetical protein P8P74_16150 [Crocinitomicaceae bacterium]|nr:hypothetical protein [Crocinitomicaceae bacterium]
MNLDKDFLKLFESELLFESVVEGITLYIFDYKINYTHVPPYTKMTLSAAKGLRSAVIDFYEGKDVDFCNIIKFMSSADIDPDAREWGANRPTEVTSISDSMVIRGMAHKLIANFYLTINQPEKPTKLFNNLEGSISWSLEQLEKRKSA